MGRRRSKQGGGGWSVSCRTLSKDARDPPHPGLGPLRDYISQKAPREAASLGGLAASLAAEPGAAAAAFSQSSLGCQPSRDWALCDATDGFPGTGVWPSPESGGDWPRLGCTSVVSCRRHAGAGSQWVRAGDRQQPGPPPPPRAGGVSEHTPPPSPFEAAPNEPRKHTGVIRSRKGGTSTSTALLSFPPSILFLESSYSINSLKEPQPLPP